MSVAQGMELEAEDYVEKPGTATKGRQAAQRKKITFPLFESGEGLGRAI